MSAYFLLAAAAPKPPLAKSRSSHSINQRSGRSSSTGTAPSRASIKSATAGSSTGSSRTGTRERRQFDVEKLVYVEPEATMSLFELKLQQFNDAVAVAKENSVCEDVTRVLNERTRSSASGTQIGSPLLTTDNLEVLRYNYYEKFGPNAMFVRDQLRQKTPAYMNVIAADEQVDRLIVQDVSNAQAPSSKGSHHTLDEARQCQKRSMNMDHQASFLRPPSPVRSLNATMSPLKDAVRGRVAAMQRRLNCPAVQTADYCASVRDALHLALFWDDVYHDIRSSHTLGENYYEWLPSRQAAQRFFISLLDFALSRLRVVTCAMSAAEAGDMNADERHELARNQYFYFQRADAALLECLLTYLKNTFLAQIEAYVVRPDMSRISELMAIVVANVCDNLKLHFYGHSRAESTTALFQDFMLAILDALMLGDGTPEPAPEPALEPVPVLVSRSLSPLSLATSVFDRVNTETGRSYVLRDLDTEPGPRKDTKRSKWGFLRRSHK